VGGRPVECGPRRGPGAGPWHQRHEVRGRGLIVAAAEHARRPHQCRGVQVVLTAGEETGCTRGARAPRRRPRDRRPAAGRRAHREPARPRGTRAFTGSSSPPPAAPRTAPPPSWATTPWCAWPGRRWRCTTTPAGPQCVQAQGWPDRGVVTGQVHSRRTVACGTCRAAVCGWCAGTSGGCSATSVAAHGGPSSNARSVVSAAAADRPVAGGAGAGTRVRGGPPARWPQVRSVVVERQPGARRRHGRGLPPAPAVRPPLTWPSRLAGRPAGPATERPARRQPQRRRRSPGER